MGKRDELNELAMVAVELRRQNMTIPKIALFLGVPEIKVWRPAGNRPRRISRPCEWQTQPAFSRLTDPGPD